MVIVKLIIIITFLEKELKFLLTERREGVSDGYINLSFSQMRLGGTWLIIMVISLIVR